MEVHEAAELLRQETESEVPHEKIQKETRSAKRTVVAAVLVSVVAVAGAACAVFSRGGAVAAPVPPSAHLMQLSSADVKDMQDRLASIQASSADAEAKLQAGAAALAERMFSAPQAPSAQRFNEGEQAGDAFKAKLSALSQGDEPDSNSVIQDKMQVQMQALAEAQERIRMVSAKLTAHHPVSEKRREEDEAVDCNGSIDELRQMGDILYHKMSCSHAGWYRVYLDTIMREGAGFDTPQVKVLSQGTLVHVAEFQGRRAHVDKVGHQLMDAAPMEGWISQKTGDNVNIIRPSKSVALFERLGGNSSNMVGKVYEQAMLLAEKNGFSDQFKSTARATAMQQELAQKLKAIDPDRLAAGMSNMNRHKTQAEQNIAKSVTETGTKVGLAMERTVEHDAGKVADALERSPKGQKLIEATRKMVTKEVPQNVDAGKLLSNGGKDFLNSIAGEFGR